MVEPKKRIGWGGASGGSCAPHSKRPGGVRAEGHRTRSRAFWSPGGAEVHEGGRASASWIFQRNDMRFDGTGRKPRRNTRRPTSTGIHLPVGFGRAPRAAEDRFLEGPCSDWKRELRHGGDDSGRSGQNRQHGDFFRGPRCEGEHLATKREGFGDGRKSFGLSAAAGCHGPNNSHGRGRSARPPGRRIRGGSAASRAHASGDIVRAVAVHHRRGSHDRAP